MKASEYGQSLLSDIRERNKAEQRRAEKRAKRDAWKQVGLQVAFSVAEDILQQRHQKLMNNEELMANKLKIDSVYEEANNFATKYQEAQDYAGGQDAYLRNELDGLIGTQLHNEYAPGTYSKSQFNSLKNSLVEGYFGKYKEAFETRARAHKQFMVSGDKDRYYANLKAMMGDGTIGSSLTQLIKKIPGVSQLTGNVNADLHKANQDILNSLGTKTGTRVDKDGKTVESKGLQTYQEIYRKTKDTELAAYVANNIKDIELSAPAPDYSDFIEIEIPNGVGGTRKLKVKEETRYNTDGSIKSSRFVTLTGKGYVGVSQESLQGSIDFMTGSGLLKEEQLNVGRVALQQLKPEDLLVINDAQEAYLDSDGVNISDTDPNYGDMLETRNDLIARTVTMSGLTAQNQGWGTQKEGREISLKMILKDIKEDEGFGDNVVTGLDNPFETAFTAYELIDTKKIDADSVVIPKIMSSGDKLYDTLYGLDSKERQKIADKLEDLDYFDKYANGEAIENMMYVIQYAIDNDVNPNQFGGKAEMLAYVQNWLEENDIRAKETQARLDRAQKAREKEEQLKKFREQQRQDLMQHSQHSSLLFPKR
jgi:hypothetical protein